MCLNNILDFHFEQYPGYPLTQSLWAAQGMVSLILDSPQPKKALNNFPYPYSIKDTSYIGNW